MTLLNLIRRGLRHAKRMTEPPDHPDIDAEKILLERGWHPLEVETTQGQFLILAICVDRLMHAFWQLFWEGLLRIDRKEVKK